MNGGEAGEMKEDQVEVPSLLSISSLIRRLGRDHPLSESGLYLAQVELVGMVGSE